MKVLGSPYGESSESVAIALANGGTAISVPVSVATGGGPASPRIVWNPGGGGDAQTWAEVMTLLATSGPHTEIWCAGTGHTIPGEETPATYNLNGAYFNSLEGIPLLITVGNGATTQATLRDCSGLFGSTEVSTNQNSAPTFDFTDWTGALFTMSGTAVGLSPLGTAAMFQPPASANWGIKLVGIAVLGGIGGPQSVELAADNILTVYIYDSVGGSFANSSVGGDATSAIILAHDGSLQTTLPGWMATYSGALFNRPFSRQGGNGPTSLRPDDPQLGCLYTDTTLNATILWNGAVWQPLFAGARVIARGSVNVGATNESTVGPFTRLANEKVTLGLFPQTSANGDSFGFAPGGGTDYSIAGVNSSDTGDDFHVVISNATGTARDIDYVVIGTV